jgi:hypothetical protein
MCSTPTCRPWRLCIRLLDRSGLECISDFPGVGWHVLFDFNHVAVLRFGTAKRSIHGFCQTRSDPAPPASENTSSSSVDCSIPRGASPGKQSNTSAQVLNQIMGPISREPSKKRVHEEPDWGLLKVQQREEARMRREQVSPSIVDPTKKGWVRPSGRSSRPDLSQQLVADHCRTNEIMTFDCPSILDSWMALASCPWGNGKPHWPQKGGRGGGRVMMEISVFGLSMGSHFGRRNEGARRRAPMGHHGEGLAKALCRSDQHTDHQPHPPTIK